MAEICSEDYAVARVPRAPQRKQTEELQKLEGRLYTDDLHYSALLCQATQGPQEDHCTELVKTDPFKTEQRNYTATCHPK